MIVIVCNSYARFDSWVKIRIAYSNAMTRKDFFCVSGQAHIQQLLSIEAREVIFIEPVFWLSIQNYCDLMRRIR